MIKSIKPPIFDPSTKIGPLSQPTPFKPTPPQTTRPDAVSQRPDLSKFQGITQARHPHVAPGVFRGYNGPLTVGGVSFASTEAALDQIIIEHGKQNDPGFLNEIYGAALV